MVLNGDALDGALEAGRDFPGREGTWAREIDETMFAVTADGDHEHATHRLGGETETGRDRSPSAVKARQDRIWNGVARAFDIATNRGRRRGRRGRRLSGTQAPPACHDPRTRSVAAHGLSAWQVLARKRCRRSTGCLVRNGNVDIEMVSGPRHRFTEDRPARLFEIEERQVADEGRNLSIATGALTTDGHFETARRHRRP